MYQKLTIELKLSDEENKQESGSGLKLSGTSGVETKKEDLGESNPWDFDKNQEPVVISSVSTTNNTSSVQRNDISGDNIILIIGKYAAHLSIILEIALIAWICSQGMSDVYMNLQKLQGVFSICTLVVIVDAVLVNILYGRKVSLIVWALLLPFVYPMQRNKYVSGSGGLGTLCCFGFLVAFLAFFAFIFKAVAGYGEIIKIADNETRTEAVAVMDQTAADGQRIGDKIMKKVYVKDALVQKQGNTTVVALAGYGSVTIDGDVFMDTGNSNIETQMAFVKQNNGTYELRAVILNGAELSSYGAQSYWNSVILK